jgi:hypothetical protein
MMKNRQILMERFEKNYPGKRLLSIHLNGFSHAVFYDNGSPEDEIKIARYSNFAPEIKELMPLGEMFEGYPNEKYKKNAEEIVYLDPKER